MKLPVPILARRRSRATGLRSLLRSARLWLGGLLVLGGSLTAGDITESPFPQEPGKWYLEVDVVRSAHDESAGVRTQSVTYGETLLVRGLTPDTDVQLSWIPYHRVTESTTGQRERAGGPGNLTLRLNHNLARATDDAAGIGLLPYLTLPTGTRRLEHGHVSGGVIVPVAWTWSESMTVSAMVDAAMDRSEDDSRYRLYITASVSLDRKLSDRLSAYLEFANAADSWRHHAWATTAAVGLVFTLQPGLDATIGVAAGLTRPASDREGFIRLGRTW